MVEHDGDDDGHDDGDDDGLGVGDGGRVMTGKVPATPLLVARNL